MVLLGPYQMYVMFQIFFISLGTLESLGCRYSVEDKVLKFCKGTLALLKANCYGTLYGLKGLIVTDTMCFIIYDWVWYHQDMAHTPGPYEWERHVYLEQEGSSLLSCYW